MRDYCTVNVSTINRQSSASWLCVMTAAMALATPELSFNNLSTNNMVIALVFLQALIISLSPGRWRCYFVCFNEQRVTYCFHLSFFIPFSWSLPWLWLFSVRRPCYFFVLSTFLLCRWVIHFLSSFDSCKIVFIIGGQVHWNSESIWSVARTKKKNDDVASSSQLPALTDNAGSHCSSKASRMNVFLLVLA